jgi:hypothetical protein
MYLCIHVSMYVQYVAAIITPKSDKISMRRPGSRTSAFLENMILLEKGLQLSVAVAFLMESGSELKDSAKANGNL